MIIKAYQEYEIPVSFLNDEKQKFELFIKVYCDNEKTGDEIIAHICKLTAEHIEEKGINVTIASYYNELFIGFDEFFTFKPRDKGSLAGNNVHIQVLQGGLNG